MKIKTFLLGLFCCMNTLSGLAFKYDWCELEKRSLIPEAKVEDIIEIYPYKDLVNACIAIYDSTGALVYSETATVIARGTYSVYIDWLSEGTYLFVLADGERKISITLNR